MAPSTTNWTGLPNEMKLAVIAAFDEKDAVDMRAIMALALVNTVTYMLCVPFIFKVSIPILFAASYVSNRQRMAKPASTNGATRPVTGRWKRTLTLESTSRLYAHDPMRSKLSSQIY